MGSVKEPDTTQKPPPPPRPLPLSDPTASWFQDWYYKIELEPSVVTDGKDYLGQIPIRLLLRGIDVAGQRCLDVGAMEGVMSILMERRQAARVVAYDRMPNDEKVKTVREKLGAKFEYVAGMELPDMPQAVSRDGSSLFDVVVCGGLLYHAFDPLTALCRVRGMVRPGGVLLLETAAVLEEGYGMYFNAEGAIYNACSNFWFPSVGCLDYLVRYLRLRPLDCMSFLPGSCCPHYDGEAERRPAYHAYLESGDIKPGYAIEDGAAAHFRHGRLERVVSKRAGAKAYYVSIDKGTVNERALDVTQLPAA